MLQFMKNEIQFILFVGDWKWKMEGKVGGQMLGKFMGLPSGLRTWFKLVGLMLIKNIEIIKYLKR